jgi:hypothetical protein
MERTTESATKSKIVVFNNEWSATGIPFADYILSQIAESFSFFKFRCGLSAARDGGLEKRAGQLPYWRWKTRVIGL